MPEPRSSPARRTNSCPVPSRIGAPETSVRSRPGQPRVANATAATEVRRSRPAAYSRSPYSDFEEAPSARASTSRRGLLSTIGRGRSGDNGERFMYSDNRSQASPATSWARAPLKVLAISSVARRIDSRNALSRSEIRRRNQSSSPSLPCLRVRYSERFSASCRAAMKTSGTITPSNTRTPRAWNLQCRRTSGLIRRYPSTFGASEPREALLTATRTRRSAIT